LHVPKLVFFNEPTPQASSKECVQVLDTDDATLAAPTVDDEY
jgi:hypothetical protein